VGSRVRLIYSTTSEHVQTLLLIKVCLIVDLNRFVTYCCPHLERRTGFPALGLMWFSLIVTGPLKKAAAAILHAAVSWLYYEPE
jgi:hypothetical protein